MRILDAAIQRPWAITEPMLRTILDIAARENGSVEAVSTQLGRPLNNTQTVTMRDGIATIPVAGPIFRHANLFTEVSGATSIEILARDFTAALNDASVRGIILDIDSPGGTVSGVHEFAEMVYRARGRKPITAYVGNLAASAAYWIASAADEIVLDDTAALGSIGVVAVVPDPAQRKVRDLEIVSSQSPNKRLDPSTDAGRMALQREVDTLADIFVGAVARNRGRSAEQVIAEMGGGGIEIGLGAIAAGLGDRLGNYEELMDEMRKKQMPQTRMYRTAAWAATSTLESEDMNVKEAFAVVRRALSLDADEEPQPVTETTEETTTEAAAETATIDPHVAELEAELERLRADDVARKAAAEAAAEEERTKRVDAEVAAALAKYGETLGRDSVKALEPLLREAKAAKVEASLLAFLDTLGGPVPMGGRVPAAAITEGAIVETVTGAIDPDTALHNRIVAYQQTDAGKGKTYREAYDIVTKADRR